MEDVQQVVQPGIGSGIQAVALARTRSSGLGSRTRSGGAQAATDAGAVAAGASVTATTVAPPKDDRKLASELAAAVIGNCLLQAAEAEPEPGPEPEPEPEPEPATVEQPLSRPFGLFEVQPACPADHHFLSEPAPAGKAAKPLMRRVMQEWDMLGEGLPVGVSVLAYEDRLDLLRCNIEGPAGTPYEGGLFTIDLQLPETYPQVCPRAFYHSHGRYANPNLYKDGKVCLSLLGTWGGPGWDAAVSTLIQLVVSVQGMVLIEHPYCNEPGQERDGGTARSVGYNKQVMADVAHLMTGTATQPLGGTGPIVADFVQREGRALVERAARLPNDCITDAAVAKLDAALGHPVTGAPLTAKTPVNEACMLGFYKPAAAGVEPALAEVFYAAAAAVPRWLVVGEAFTAGYTRGDESEEDDY